MKPTALLLTTVSLITLVTLSSCEQTGSGHGVSMTGTKAIEEGQDFEQTWKLTGWTARSPKLLGCVPRIRGARGRVVATTGTELRDQVESAVFHYQLDSGPWKKRNAREMPNEGEQSLSISAIIPEKEFGSAQRVSWYLTYVFDGESRSFRSAERPSVTSIARKP
jgi:hypothetical protein